MTFYVIEHRSRGVFTHFDWEYAKGGKMVRKPHFKWSIRRTEGKNFYSLEEARKVKDKLDLNGVSIFEFPGAKLVK